MQAILFGKQELQLFDTSSHDDFFEHFKLLSEISYELETEVLVFGAPKNRKRNQISVKDADEIAVEFFSKVGEIFKQSNSTLAIENNPIEYMCDYMTNVSDVQNIVNQVNSEGIKVHLDSAGIHMCGGDIADIIKDIKNFSHYHISEPMLNPIHEQKVEHKKALNTLKDINYKNWISIEMKQTNDEYNDIKKSLEYISKIGV
jgi:sugar phosphate isomerase/epimerase